MTLAATDGHRWTVGRYDDADEFRLDLPGEGDIVFAVFTDEEGEVLESRVALFDTAPGGGHGFYDTQDMPIPGQVSKWRDATGVEMSDFEHSKHDEDGDFR